VNTFGRKVERPMRGGQKNRKKPFSCKEGKNLRQGRAVSCGKGRKGASRLIMTSRQFLALEGDPERRLEYGRRNGFQRGSWSAEKARRRTELRN